MKHKLIKILKLIPISTNQEYFAWKKHKTRKGNEFSNKRQKKNKQ